MFILCPCSESRDEALCLSARCLDSWKDIGLDANQSYKYPAGGRRLVGGGDDGPLMLIKTSQRNVGCSPISANV